MTEADWMTCADPESMLQFIRPGASDRKLRLFACACCRTVWDLLVDKRSRIAIQKLEEYADDLGNEKLRRDAYNTANAAYSELYAAHPTPNSAWSAACAVVCAADRMVPPNLYGNLASALMTSRSLEFRAVQELKSELLRHLFGNPIKRAAVKGEWLTSDVVTLALGIYRERAFDQMPILADALQDADCDDEEILKHCRDEKTTHVRGCWVVDSLLGKE